MAKRKQGKRDKSGKLLRPATRAARLSPFDYGNAWVQARAALFAIFRPEGAKEFKPEQHCDGPGQAHIAGLFDNLPADAIAIRDAAREYGDLYWYQYKDLQAKCANFSGSHGGKGDGNDTRRDWRFLALDKSLGKMTSPERHGVSLLCVDYWGRDEIAPTLQRLINQKLAERRQPVAGYLPTARDQEIWTAACKGLLAMVTGTNVEDERSAA